MRNLLHRIKTQRGQSFMEFAISLMFLLVFLSGVVDLGWGFFSMVSLRDSVQESAAVGSICPFASQEDIVRERFNEMVQAPPLNVTDPDNPAEIEFEICVIDPNDATNPVPFAVPGCANLTPQRGYSVRVSARVQHHIVTPFIGAIFGTQTYPLEATSSNTVLIEKEADCPFD